MRFALTLTDHYKQVLDHCLQIGWEPVRLFLCPLDEHLFSNKSVLETARQRGIPVQISPIQLSDLRELGAADCEILMAASYSHHIPPWRDYLPYAINFHPSPLPQARGPYPQVRAILEGVQQWGVSCHVIEEKFDSGAILAQELFSLSPQENLTTLEWKNKLALGRLLPQITSHLPALWATATPQGAGSYWPYWTPADRTLDLTASVHDADRKLRAFGEINCLASVNGVQLCVHRAHCWAETHTFAPGTLLQNINMHMLIALKDGFLVISEWSLHEAGAVTGRIVF